MRLGKSERRTHSRQSIRRLVKLRVEEGGRYLTGQLRNVSTGGLFVEIDQPSAALVCGQQVLVGIAWTPRHMLLASESLIEATVVRCSVPGHRPCVAMRFKQEMELARAA